MPSNLPSVCSRVLITALIVVLRITAWIILAVCASALALILPGMYLVATGQVQPRGSLAMGDIAMSMPEYWREAGCAFGIIVATILIESLGVHLLHKLRARLALQPPGI